MLGMRARMFARAATRPSAYSNSAVHSIPEFRLGARSRLASTQTATPRPPNVGRNGAIAVALIAAATATYFYERSTSTSTSSSGKASDSGGRPFQVTTGRGRSATTHTFNRLAPAAIDTKLHEHEDGQVISRPGNPVVRWDRNWVAANEPCEDRSAVDLIPRSRSARDMPASWLGKWFGSANTVSADSGCSEGGSEAVKRGEKDIMMFSIIDGHAGFATSELLSKVLHPTLTLSLAGLQAGVINPLSPSQGLKSLVSKLNPLSWMSAGEQWSSDSVAMTISATFLSLDHNICQAPVHLLPTLKTSSKSASSSPTDESDANRQLVAALAEPADNGACCLSAVVDAEEGDLYVALAGDCRAVAGWEKDGIWRCDVLSEDQMGENDREIARLRKEHPGEDDTVIFRGRIMGGLQPTRAFGDASYKWQHNEAEEIVGALRAEGKKGRPPRPLSKTPPYVTAEPVIEHRKIRGKDGEQLRFVIMATDGLWDRITSEEATLLLASYLSHPKHPEIHKSQLPTKFPLTPPVSPDSRPYPAQTLPGTGDRAGGTWVFEGDQNAATHLIRNSLAGGDRDEMVKLLSMTGGVTRWFRDDVTVTYASSSSPSAKSALLSEILHADRAE